MFPQSTLQVWEVQLNSLTPRERQSDSGASVLAWRDHHWKRQWGVFKHHYTTEVSANVNTDGKCYNLCVCTLLTICICGFSGFSLQSLSKELLLFGQVLLYKAVLTHLLSNLRYTQEEHTSALNPTYPFPYQCNRCSEAIGAVYCQIRGFWFKPIYVV